jgi:hypothetical protein
MPFICLARTDIPNSTLQVTDLWPNKSQYNPTLDPPAVGPLYIDAVVTNNVVLIAPVGGTLKFVAAVSGLAAYLLANVQASGAGGSALTPTQANDAATAIIAAMRAGSSLSLAAINALLVIAAGAGTELTTAGGSLSTGAVSDVLRILAGISYTVPAGTTVQVAGVFTAQAGAAAWNAANFAVGNKDILPTDSSFYQSLAYGKIAGFKSASFSYKGVTGAAITVYDDAGGVY